jgi:Ca-activated chloride channel family protein
MKPWVGVFLLAVTCVAQTPFRVDVNLVNVGFSVRDSRGNLVTDLTQDDFEVFEDGAGQKVSFFARSGDVPLDLGLLVDVSGSQDSFVRPHHRDLEAFLKSVLTSQDRAFLLCFGNHLRLVYDYSASPGALAGALEHWDSGRMPYAELGPREHRILGTAFYDAVYYSITERLASAERGRRALIIFSDGEDNSSAHHMLDAIETAQSNDVLLFSIRYTEIHDGRLNARNKYGISVMERISRETGGADFDAREKGLKDNFRLIGEQLRCSYELAYQSTNPRDGSFHKVQIRPKRAGLTVRARTGYFAQ